MSYRIYLTNTNVDCKYYGHPVVNLGLHSRNGQYTQQEMLIIAPDGYKADTTYGGGNGPDLKQITGTDYIVETGYTVTFVFTAQDYGPGSSACMVFFPYVNMYNAGCLAIAYDYINMKMSHLCSDKSEACPGDMVTLTAYDYEPSALIEWQYSLDSLIWNPFDTSLISERNTSKIVYPSVAAGPVLYRTKLLNA